MRKRIEKINIAIKATNAAAFLDRKKEENKMIEKAKELASRAMTEVNLVEVKPEDCFVVWFCKTLQNWKALVSTNVLQSSANGQADYCEVTHNGDKNETYVDVYCKAKNICYADEK